MKYSLSTHHVSLSDPEVSQLDRKLDRLERHLVLPAIVDVRLTRDLHHKHGDVIVCRVNIEQGKNVFHAERSADSVLDAIDAVVDVLTRELTRDRTRRRDTSRQ